MAERIIEKLIDKHVDIDFDFGDIADNINFSRYERLKHAPRNKYLLVGSLSAAAVAVLAVTVVIPFTIPKYNAAAPAIDKTYNMPNNTQQGGAAYVPSHMEENNDATIQRPDEPSFGPAEGQQVAHGGATAPIDGDTVAGDDKGYPDASENYTSEQIERLQALNDASWKISINEDIAALIDEDGDVFELDKQVIYRDKYGNDIALSDFMSGEAVFASFDIVDGQFRVAKVKRKQ